MPFGPNEVRGLKSNLRITILVGLGLLICIVIASLSIGDVVDGPPENGRWTYDDEGNREWKDPWEIYMETICAAVFFSIGVVILFIVSLYNFGFMAGGVVLDVIDEDDDARELASTGVDPTDLL